MNYFLSAESLGLDAIYYVGMGWIFACYCMFDRPRRKRDYAKVALVAIAWPVYGLYLFAKALGFNIRRFWSLPW